MTGDHDEGLGRMAEELNAALAAGEAIAIPAWAERFAVEPDEVAQVLRALRALDTGLGEELVAGHPELPAPRLPADYEVRGELGRGGMGVVYRAHQRSLDREVAIKVLRPGDLAFGDAMRRFRAEAKNLARLRHRHIVSVHDLGESPDGTLWFAMDLIEGGTLADELRRHRRLLPSRAVRIVRQIGAAIAHAHSLGIVHRDLKPQNVLIDRHGDAFVVDFGLARDASAAGARTLTSELLGTPAYMSPEQARGDSARIGEASDVWALGALLYELLTGRSPFAGKPLHETIRAILEDDPTPPRRLDARVPVELEAVCLQALRKQPEDRYATALAFTEDIERFADGRGVLATPPSRWAGVGRALLRQRRTLLLMTAGVVATAALAAYWLPAVRRAAVLAEAERLLGGGHPGAAIDSLRAQLAGAGGDAEQADRLHLLLARAHNDRAAESLHGGDLPAAERSAHDALALADRSSGRFGVVRESELERHRAWRWEWARARAITEPGGRLPRTDGDAVLQAQLGIELRRASAASAELAALVAARFSLAGPELDEPTRLRAIEALVAVTSRRLAGSKADAALFPLHVTGADLDAWWSPAVEVKLAELATSPKLAPRARAVAFRAFCQLIGMPVWAADDVTPPTDDALASAAERVVAAWQRWQHLPRAAAIAARIELLIEAIERPDQVLPGARLSGLLHEWTGRAPPTQGLSGWWRELQAQPLAALLRAGLGLPADAPIDTAAALDASSLEPPARAMLWRQLAWLQAVDGAPLLTCLPRTGDGGWRWRHSCLQAAAAADSRPFVVHMAVVRFDDGDPEPRLVAQVARRATIGAPVELALDVEHGSLAWFSLRREFEDDGDHLSNWVSAHDLQPLRQSPPIGRCRATLRGNVVLDAAGIRLRGRAHLDAAFPETSSRDSLATTDTVGLDGAACFAQQLHLWELDQHATSLLVLVHLAAGDSTADFELAAFRSAAVRAVQAAASATPGHWRRTAMDWVLPAHQALPEVLAELEALAPTEQAPTEQAVAQAARQLAGGAVAPLQLLQGYRVPLALRPVHAALAVRDAARREALLQELATLAPASWRPAIAATLRRGAAERGFTLPPQLAATVDAQSEPDSLVAWCQRRGLLWHALLVGLSLVVFWRNRRRAGPRVQLHALIALVMWAVLPQVRIRIGGVVCNPTWLCLGLVLVWCATASWRWPWYRVLGALLLAGATIWSLLMWLGLALPPPATPLQIAAIVLAGWDQDAFRPRTPDPRPQPARPAP